MTLRRRVSLELLLLGTSTAVFLLLLPQRPLGVDLGLAILALGLVGLNAGFTRNAIWGRFPPRCETRRLRRCLVITSGVTAGGVFGILSLGIGIAYAQGGWEEVTKRIFTWRLFPAIGLYFPWALLQQTLFQFYLLGRLRVLIPSKSPLPAIALTGIGYALVHLPDWEITVVTSLAGIFWSSLYYAFRVLSPIDLSHAILGSTFYYWVYGEDLLGAWISGSVILIDLG
jgi:Type II CAAX prenyl endopeptidase Rce1-like